MGEGRIPEYQVSGTPSSPIIPALRTIAILPSSTTPEARAEMRD